MSKRANSEFSIIVKNERAKLADDLIIAKAEKAEREYELIIANEEKTERAAMLVIAKAAKAKRQAESVITIAERVKRQAGLIIANAEKAKKDNGTITTNKEQATAIVIANVKIIRHLAELLIAKVENAKRAAALIISNKKPTSELIIADAEQAKREAMLLIASIKDAKRSSERIIYNIEKVKGAAEFVITDKEAVYQNAQKAKRAAALIVASVVRAKREAELVIANVVKAKRAAELVIANKELNLAKVKAKMATDLITLNKELIHQIDKRKESDHNLKESKEKFHSYIEHSPVGVFVVDKTGKYYDCNPAAYEIVGYTREELLSMSIIDLLPADEVEKGLQGFEQLCKEGFLKVETKLLRKDKSTIYVILEAVKLPENNMFLSFTTDIQKIKVAEFELRKKFDEVESINIKLRETNIELLIAKDKAEEGDRLKSAFLANMSHEIRTPMNGILGFASLLKEPKLSGEEQQEYIHIIEKSGARMLNIIDDIVCVSKIESGIMETYLSETNINEQTEYVYNLFKLDAARKKLTITFKNGLPDNESIVNTDKEKFISVLSNLVKNAIKYTDIGSVEFGYNLKNKNKSGDLFNLEFYVKDTGIGVPKNMQEAIFERFIQADVTDKMARYGAGLGLAISRAYVGVLGGRIWVESKKGKGSIFYFTIPYSRYDPKRKKNVS
jgi:PAS domain S-box-containing protein